MNGLWDSLLISTRISTHINRITGMTHKEFPLCYLGVPIFAGRSRLIYFEYLVEKVRKKLDWWKAKLLSFAGRITLIQSVLSSISIYTLASSYVPITIIKRMEKLISNFLWHSRGERRIHRINWESVCRPQGVRRSGYTEAFEYSTMSSW